MNWQWGGKRVGALAAVAVTVVAIGATTGSAFGQNKNSESAAMRIQQIEDRQAIEQLLMGDYPRALDSANWKAYSALFAQDGTLIMQGGAIKRTGPAAIEEFFTKMPAFGGQAAAATPSPCPVPAGTPRTMHVVTNLSLHIDGDTATDQAYWQTIATRDCKSVVAGSGHYEDTLKARGRQMEIRHARNFRRSSPQNHFSCGWDGDGAKALAHSDA